MRHTNPSRVRHSLLALAGLAVVASAFSGFEHVAHGNAALKAAQRTGVFKDMYSKLPETTKALFKSTDFDLIEEMFGEVKRKPPTVLDTGTKYFEKTLLGFGAPERAPLTPVTYGDVVALGGDFFGYIPQSHLVASTPYTAFGAMEGMNRETMFGHAVTTLKEDERKAVPGIVEAFKEEYKMYKKGEKANQIMETLEFAKLSRGKRSLVDGWSEWFDLWRTRLTSTNELMVADAKHQLDSITDSPYLKLLNENNDHFPGGFAHYGIKAYKAGHHRAVQKARVGANICLSLKNVEKRKKCMLQALRFALATNAFADHFLSDMSSAGHVRTPIVELREKCGAYAGGLYANVAHDEDNKRGLLTSTPHQAKVALAAGRPTPADLIYGDGRFLDIENMPGRKKAIKCLKHSILEVVEWFVRPRESGEPAYRALQYIPHPVKEKAAPPLWKLRRGDGGEVTILVRMSTCVDGAARFTYEELDCSPGIAETLDAAIMKFGRNSAHGPDPCGRDREQRFASAGADSGRLRLRRQHPLVPPPA